YSTLLGCAVVCAHNLLEAGGAGGQSLRLVLLLELVRHLPSQGRQVVVDQGVQRSLHCGGIRVFTSLKLAQIG
ncbi:MAG: hypothetical protein ACK55Z_21005, partial [bacterium]